MSTTHDELRNLCRKALDNREDYWTEVANRLVWTEKWSKVFDDSDAPFYKWFVGGKLSLCYNCVDRHVDDGFGDKVAFVFLSPVTNARREYTFKDLQARVARLSGVLSSWGVVKGDVVMIYMPMVPEGAISLLACARIGAIHVAVPSGLPSADLAVRIDHSKPKVMITASYGYHPEGWVNYKTEVDGGIKTANHKPQKVLVFQRTHKEPAPLQEGRDFDWKDTLLAGSDAPCLPLESNEPAFMVYTSGSTGVPKAIVHSVGRFSCRMTHDIPLIYGRTEDDEVCFMSCNFGWLASHFVVTYGPFLCKIKTIIFEGDPLLSDDVQALYKIISEEKVSRAFIRPGVIRMLKAMDPSGEVAARYNLDRLASIITGGEKTDVTTLNWGARNFRCPVWNAWGQSECGSVVSGIPDRAIGKDQARVIGPGIISPGWQLFIRKSDGTEGGTNELGRILIKLPTPPGSFLTLFQNKELCKKTYFTEFPGFFDTKDMGYLDEQGRLIVECRSDDVIQAGQVLLPAQELEELALSHDSVSECIAVSVYDPKWTEIPLIMYMKRDGCTLDNSQVSKELEERISKKYGSKMKFGGAIYVKELPRTRTGKVHRPSSNALARGQPVQGTGAVENPYVFDNVLSSLKAAGFGKK